jgi:hypothetical protein
MFASLNCRVPLRLGPPLRTKCFMTRRHVATKTRQAREPTGAQESSPEEIERFLKTVEGGKLGFDPWANRLPLFGEGRHAITRLVLFTVLCQEKTCTSRHL